MKRINRLRTSDRITSHRPRTESQRLVLYVEDDRDNREVASARLDKNYDLLLADDDREACEVLCKKGTDLALVLMDIELKGSRLNGIDLTRLIRGKLDSRSIPSYAKSVPQLRVPILFVTAYGRNYNRAELLLAGGDDVIQKPVDFIELHAAMTRAYLNRIGQRR